MKGLGFVTGNLIKKFVIIVILAMVDLAGISFSSDNVVFAASVEEVKATVYSDGHIPDGVCQRMEKSVQAIGAQLLEGKSLENVHTDKTIDQQAFRSSMVINLEH